MTFLSERRPTWKMTIWCPIRKATLLCTPLYAVVSINPAQAVSQLPASPPTSSVATQAQQTTLAPVTHRAAVNYSGGMLSVHASNSSLNQILRDISRATGMKITGGVAEDRVFGNYGPAAPAKVLNALLDGTASNMLLVEDGHAAPAELILTPRTGAVTPPDPNSFHEDAAEDHPPQASTPVPAPAAAQEPANSSPQPSPSSTALPTPPTDGTQPSPNGVKTPQEIYDQLQRLRNQQQHPPS